MLCMYEPDLFYETGTAYSLLHVLLIRLQDISYAVHQLLDLGGQALGRRLLQDPPDQLLCVSVALVVHHGRGPGPAGRPAVVVAPSQRDMALGVGGQRGLRRLGGRICGLRGGSEGSVAAALHYSRHQRERTGFRFSSYPHSQHIANRAEYLTWLKQEQP